MNRFLIGIDVDIIVLRLLLSQLLEEERNSRTAQVVRDRCPPIEWACWLPPEKRNDPVAEVTYI